jgi:hypothetical protein
MGMIYDDHGAISIEGRSESFLIHAAYGYEPETKMVGELELGTYFVMPNAPDDEVVQLVALELHAAATYERAGDPGRRFPINPTTKVVWCYEETRRPNSERPRNTSFARSWREDPHPEFLIGDLDDVIAALVDYRTKL